jgi:hypothetical protein
MTSIARAISPGLATICSGLGRTAGGVSVEPLANLARDRGCTGAGALRGLQNRLRGAVEASWVGSIPIHPRQISVS